ncbi:DciA family protein [Aurantimonas sp. VKM B-3413]|nr:DciA family protein [Aurantimonas sp. VKM B-3413]MCB8837418.1 DciA family protein [Aurantimonas sp. VKM B-3413]
MSETEREAGPKRRRGVRPLADVVSELMDPILRRKAGMTTGLVAAWADIAGPRLSDATRPEKLVWPPQRGEAVDHFEPATLVLACEAAAALRVQHQSSELIARVNAFFGYPAVARIKLVQKPVTTHRPDKRPPLRELTADDHRRVEAMVARIEDPGLRAALTAFAEASLQRSRN